MNSVMLIGNLTKDPELRYVPGERQLAVCTFSIAVSEGYGDKQETQFVNIKVFGKIAENCDRYLTKGRAVGVTGKLKTCYKDKEGNTKYYTEVIANDIQFLGGTTDKAPEGFSRVREEDVPF